MKEAGGGAAYQQQPDVGLRLAILAFGSALRPTDTPLSTLSRP
jgi:hypothetical protein